MTCTKLLLIITAEILGKKLEHRFVTEEFIAIIVDSMPLGVKF